MGVMKTVFQQPAKPQYAAVLLKPCHDLSAPVAGKPRSRSLNQAYGFNHGLLGASL